VFAPFANTPAHAVEGPLFDCAAGKLVIAGIASANTRFGESASVSSNTPTEFPFDALAGLTASARAATPFAITRAFAGMPEPDGMPAEPFCATA
jgi:hypothetical protein